MAVTIVNELPTNYTNDVFTGDRQYLISAIAGTSYSKIEDKTSYSTVGSTISAGDLNAITAAINRANTVADATLTVGGWVGASAPYTQEVTGLTGMSATTSYPIFTFAGTTAAQWEAFTYISKCVPGTDKVTFTCYSDKPTTDIPIYIKGF